MLLRERFKLHVLTLKETVGLQELVDLLGNGVYAGGADTVTIQNVGLGLLDSDVADTGIQSAAAEGAEGNHFLAGKVHLVKQGGDRRSIGAEPNGEADEDGLIGGEVRFQGLDLRRDTRLAVLHRTGDGGLEIPVVGCYRDDFFDISTQLVGDFLRDGLGVGRLGIIKDERFRCGFFLSAGDEGYEGGNAQQKPFHVFHIAIGY